MDCQTLIHRCLHSGPPHQHVCRTLEGLAPWLQEDHEVPKQLQSVIVNNKLFDFTSIQLMAY